jgi:chromosome partitioning protein
MRITIGLGKGGSAKSLTAIYLALGLAQRGGRVLLVDADGANATVRDWRENTEDWPAAVVVQGFTSRLAEQVRQVENDYDHVVIDTGPAHPELLRDALLVTGELLVPVGPSAVELRQLGETLKVAAAVDAFRPVNVRVLLTKMRAGTRSATQAREYLAGLELPVMDTTVSLREAYPASWGEAPAELLDYAAVLAELLGEDASDQVPDEDQADDAAVTA